MKDNGIIITVLNKILSDEHKFIKHNNFPPKISTDWEFGELYEEINKETVAEMKQTEDLIKRSVFREVWRTDLISIKLNQNNSKDCYEEVNNFV